MARDEDGRATGGPDLIDRQEVDRDLGVPDRRPLGQSTNFREVERTGCRGIREQPGASARRGQDAGDSPFLKRSEDRNVVGLGVGQDERPGGLASGLGDDRQEFGYGDPPWQVDQQRLVA